ncbi:MAG: aldehyde dehydrogenase EutE, partial [Ruminococcaceae bacterium]|nr:aldehyde dehydrogenase EutE [Oscillospiraceae bacterium]
MRIDETQISEIVKNVLASVSGESNVNNDARSYKGVFDSMSDALEAVNKAYKQYRAYTVEQREQMIAKIREYTLNEAEEMAKLGVSETGMGRVSDKIIKHQLVANKTPGTEDLSPSVMTGDAGLTLVEMAPYGVIGSITTS